MHNLIGLQENIRKKVSSKSMDSISGAVLLIWNYWINLIMVLFHFFTFVFVFKLLYTFNVPSNYLRRNGLIAIGSLYRIGFKLECSNCKSIFSLQYWKKIGKVFLEYTIWFLEELDFPIQFADKKKDEVDRSHEACGLLMDF